jgi:hypothetical protein
MKVRLDLKDFLRFVIEFFASAIIELHASTSSKQQVNRRQRAGPFVPHPPPKWVATPEEFTERIFAD